MARDSRRSGIVDSGRRRSGKEYWYATSGTSDGNSGDIWAHPEGCSGRRVRPA